MKDFREAYKKLLDLGTPEAMLMLGSVLCEFAEYAEQSNGRLYRDAVEKMNAVNWNNYLTEAEAVQIVGSLVGQDGSKGAHWSMAQVSDAVERLNGSMECEPYYNKYALFVTMNMIYSDFSATLAQFTDAENLPEVVYRLAVDKLKDADKPRFVRAYFGV